MLDLCTAESVMSANLSSALQVWMSALEWTKMLFRCVIWVEEWFNNTKIQNLEKMLEPEEEDQQLICIESNLKSNLPPYSIGFS